jgi:hypothetical protein
MLRGTHTGWPSKATPHIKYCVTRLNIELFEEQKRCGYAAYVKFVYSAQIFDGDTRDGLTF